MDSNSPDSSGRQSRRELLSIIAQQKEQLNRYEARLKDVVRAYKGLAKEKEALEKSVAVLGKGQVSYSDNDLDSNASSAIEEKTLPNSVSLNPNDQATSEQDEPKDLSASAQVKSTNDLKVLQDSLATLTAEKSRMTNAYQEEKKRMKNEKQDLEKTIRQLQKEADEIKTKSKSETEELKSKWIVERHNREKESNDNTLMLRELQKIVGDERAGKERLELELQETKDKLKGLEMAGSYNEEYEKRVRALEVETKKKSEEIASLSAKCKETPPELLHLRQQAADMQHDHRRNLERAESRAAEAEKQSSISRASHEKRVVNLESRLQELSETVGTYDRLRQQDQVSISKLKERVHQLEDEKSTLLSSASCTSSARSSPRMDDAVRNFDESKGDEDSNLDVQTLLDRILRLKTLLRNANQRSENPVENLDDMLCEGSSAAKWKKAAHMFKEELEKLRHECVVKNTCNEEEEKSPSKTRIQLLESQSKINNLQEEVSNLREKIELFKKDLSNCHEELARYEERERKTNEEMSIYKANCKESQVNVELDLKNRIINLESELKKQRERCMTIIEEKEDEVNMLKSNMETTLEAAFRAAAKTAAKSALGNDTSKFDRDFGQKNQHQNSQSSPTDRSYSISESIVENASPNDSLSTGHSLSSTRRLRRSKSGSVSRDNVAEDLTASSSQQAEGMVLYYEEELSHKEAEIKDLRNKSRMLESSLRDLQMSFIGKEERYSDELDTLRNRISTLQRMTTKEGENLEYLKNVVLTYMLTSAAAEREHMLKAIAAVLSFTKDELTKVRHYNASWWWNEKANKNTSGATGLEFANQRHNNT